jgi:hypothetical protein
MAKKATSPTAKPSALVDTRNLIAITLLLVLSLIGPQSKSADMYPVTASDKTFFEALSYPVVLEKGGFKLKTKKDAKEHATALFDEHLKSAVRNQSPDSLFKNWQGVMIGNGEIWFSEVAKGPGKEKVWVYRIIKINQTEDQSKRVGAHAQAANPSVGESKPN